MKKILLICCFLSMIGTWAFSMEDDLFTILDSELKREFAALHEADSALYFLDFRVDDIKHISLSSSFGYTTGENDNEVRYCTITMRYGNREFDNTHLIKGERQKSYRTAFIMSKESDLAIKQKLWMEVTKLYEQVKSDYHSLKNKMKADQEVDYNDFSQESVEEYYDDPVLFSFNDSNKNDWKKRLSEYSLVFKGIENVIGGDASIRYTLQRNYYLNSEGTRVVQNYSNSTIYIRGVIKTDEGNNTSYFKTFNAPIPAELPSHDAVLESSQFVKDMLLKLEVAPVAESYAGPAIFSPQAAGVFFHEIFGHRLEAHRFKDENSSHTFRDKLNSLVLPKQFNIHFDPTVKNYKNTFLNGYYQFDDEGVRAQRVDVVKKGVLSDFLTNRTPASGLSKSNGHGRASAGRSTVSRQSNMFISSIKPYSDEELKKQLLKECKKQKKEYGYFVKSVTGGFTNTSRYRPNSFNVTPTEVYRVYLDGRPDELIRGVNFIGTPLAMFSEIAAAGNNEDVFNGICGAESGGVPVATVSPAIYIKKIETQKKVMKFAQPIILPSPTTINEK